MSGLLACFIHDTMITSKSSVIVLMMEAARITGTSVDIQLRTRQCIPENSELRPEYKIKNE
jgi:hypothetical protein